MEQAIRVMRRLVALRNCCKQSLPMGDSLIAYDLILYVAITYKKQPITPKQLFSSLPHSYSAVRHHYNLLLEGGYLVHKTAESDKRVKYIEPTEKFMSAVASYANQAKVIFNTPT